MIFFHMSLLSDSKVYMSPINKQSEFTIKLDHLILIEEESWEVALVDNFHTVRSS